MFLLINIFFKFCVIDTDSADFKPPEISYCNQFTKELINSTSCNRSYHNDRHIPSLAKELKPKE